MAAVDAKVGASMSEEILVDVNRFETRVALVVDGTLRELHIERPGGRSLRGNLYRGRVDRVVAVSYTHLTLPTIYSV